MSPRGLSESNNYVVTRDWLSTVIRPGIHQQPPLLKQIASAVGRLNLVADGMGKRHFYHFFGNFVRSAAQSRNVERKPCTVRSLRPMRSRTLSMAMLLRGLSALPPGNK